MLILISSQCGKKISECEEEKRYYMGIGKQITVHGHGLPLTCYDTLPCILNQDWSQLIAVGIPPSTLLVSSSFVSNFAQQSKYLNTRTFRGTFGRFYILFTCHLPCGHCPSPSRFYVLPCGLCPSPSVGFISYHVGTARPPLWVIYLTMWALSVPL